MGVPHMVIHSLERSLNCGLHLECWGLSPSEVFTSNESLGFNSMAKTLTSMTMAGACWGLFVTIWEFDR